MEARSSEKGGREGGCILNTTNCLDFLPLRSLAPRPSTKEVDPYIVEGLGRGYHYIE